MMHAIVEMIFSVQMQNLCHYGGRGIAIMLRPYDDKLVMSSTAGDEEFILKNSSILREFSLFTCKILILLCIELLRVQCREMLYVRGNEVQQRYGINIARMDIK